MLVTTEFKVLSSHHLSENLKIKVYRTVILPVILYVCETWSLLVREECTCLRTGYIGEYLDLRGMKGLEAGEDCVMWCFIICTLQQMSLG